MTIHATGRRAVTLVEVLIAIFLMGIGLMAILSLFPLGAAQMAQALKDQRCAEATTNADAMARIIWKIACDADPSTGPQKFYDGTGTPSSEQRFIAAMDNPNADVPTTPTNFQIANETTIPRTGPTATLPSYPVLVDPIGWLSNPATGSQHWWLPTVTANGRTWRIPRRSLYVRPSGITASTALQDITTIAAATSPQQRVFKQFSLTDDMTFELNGTPKVTANQVERQGRYTWAYLYRRSNNADRTNVDISTIVYSGRSIDVASPETAYLGTGAALTKSLSLTYSGTKPAIRRGQWILDATLSDANGNPAPQGIFYRVVNVDDSTAGSLGLELQTPLLGGPSGNNQRVILVLNNVVEVFTRTDVTQVSPPMPY
jgi:Tfp pilus assembly protein PilV